MRYQIVICGRWLSVFFLCLLWGATLAWGAPRADYYTEVLPNGMRLVLYENPRAPLCSLNIFCKVGGFEENIETMGISHFFEHLFQKCWQPKRAHMQSGSIVAGVQVKRIPRFGV